MALIRIPSNEQGVENYVRPFENLALFPNFLVSTRAHSTVTFVGCSINFASSPLVWIISAHRPGFMSAGILNLIILSVCSDILTSKSSLPFVRKSFSTLELSISSPATLISSPAFAVSGVTPVMRVWAFRLDAENSSTAKAIMESLKRMRFLPGSFPSKTLLFCAAQRKGGENV